MITPGAGEISQRSPLGSPSGCWFTTNLNRTLECTLPIMHLYRRNLFSLYSRVRNNCPLTRLLNFYYYLSFCNFHFTLFIGPLFKRLYTTFVRPHLEYAQATWSPSSQKFIDMLENVQKRATKMVDGLSAVDYEEPLRKLELPTLVYRRARTSLLRLGGRGWSNGSKVETHFFIGNSIFHLSLELLTKF